jgi:hypothetical protein
VSALSDRAIPLQSAYCASKHALKAFTESLRVELKHSGSPVQVTLVKPASINTPLFDNALSKTGVAPRPVWPVYAPSIVAGVLVHCATHPERDVAVGGGAALLTSMEALAGPLVDWYLDRTGFSGQQTEEPKPHDAPHNLYAPLASTRTSEGRFPGRRFSAYTWARVHPRLAVATLAAGLGATQALRAVARRR